MSLFTQKQKQLFAQAAADSLESASRQIPSRRHTQRSRCLPGSKQSLQAAGPPLTSCSCCALARSHSHSRGRSRRRRRRERVEQLCSASSLLLLLLSCWHSDYVALAPTKMAASSMSYCWRAHTHASPHRFDSLRLALHTVAMDIAVRCD